MWPKTYLGLRVKCPLFLSDFNETGIFWTDFRKNNEISNFMKIRLLGAELFSADGQTDVMMVTVAFRNFANAPKILLCLLRGLSVIFAFSLL